MQLAKPAIPPQLRLRPAKVLDPAGGESHFRQVLNRTLLFLLAVAAAGWCRAADPEKSVIQIITFSQQPAWEAPWRMEPVRRSGGSGFVIKGKRIMTNAHVVGWARQIIARKYQDPRPYVAEVEFVGHDCDLAVLTVEDEGFFKDLEPLDFGELPEVRSGVVTYGYPAGGEEISYTKGVVSRIEMEPYAHIGNRRLLSAQTDAAINPGNSGGPVIQDGKVVGVAFQGLQGLENTGFFIPPPVIEHFLKDIADHRYDGFVNAGLRLATLQNPAYRAFLKLPDNNQGARVDGILAVPASEKLLKVDDVLLRAGPYPVASDGTILYQGNRVSAALAFQEAQAGESVALRLWREGAEIEVSLPMSVYTGDQAAGYQYDAPPRYYIYGGLVFTPLSMDYLRSVAKGSADSGQSELYYELFFRRHEDPAGARPEPVVLAAVLADAANANVSARGRQLVDKINGARIERMEDVALALERHEGTYDVIEFLPGHNVETLERSEVKEAHGRVLKTYGISKDRRL